jgi:hypothetical protein
MRHVLITIVLTVSLLAGVNRAAIAVDDGNNPLTPGQRMQARYPQPVRVGDLIGLPIVDDNHRTLGYVREVVRTPDGKIELVVDYNALFGFFGWDTRPVAVPIEVVGIRGRELASLDMTRGDYARAPTWRGGGTAVLSKDAVVRVALTRGY